MDLPGRLDALEAVAVRAITDTYGPMLTDEARGWIQKGIEGMRLAVAIERADLELERATGQSYYDETVRLTARVEQLETALREVLRFGDDDSRRTAKDALDDFKEKIREGAADELRIALARVEQLEAALRKIEARPVGNPTAATIAHLALRRDVPDDA